MCHKPTVVAWSNLERWMEIHFYTPPRKQSALPLHISLGDRCRQPNRIDRDAVERPVRASERFPLNCVENYYLLYSWRRVFK